MGLVFVWACLSLVCSANFAVFLFQVREKLSIFQKRATVRITNIVYSDFTLFIFFKNLVYLVNRAKKAILADRRVTCSCFDLALLVFRFSSMAFWGFLVLCVVSLFLLKFRINADVLWFRINADVLWSELHSRVQVSRDCLRYWKYFNENKLTFLTYNLPGQVSRKPQS